MTKSHAIRKLLEDNRTVLLNGEENNGICFDGIVNESEYSNVVVLLKETNGCDTNGKLPDKLEDWDYCKWLKDQQADNKPEKKVNQNGEEYIEKNVFYHSTFRKLCYWLCLLFDSLENEQIKPEDYLDNGRVNVEKVRTILNRVAIVNLKKSWGNKQTNNSDIYRYVLDEKIRNILKKQMTLLKPKIVLCCSPHVFSAATLVYPCNDINPIYSQPSKSIHGKDINFVNINNCIYVDFYHPQYYGKTDKQFTAYAVEVFEHLKCYLKGTDL